MTKTIILKVAFIALLAISAGCSSPGLQVGDSYEPEPVVYKEVSDEINTAAENSLNELLSDANEPKSLPMFLVCGPFLWNRLENHPALRNTDFAVMHNRIPVVENGKIKEIRDLQGRLLQGPVEVKLFWCALTDVINLKAGWRIRKINEQEKNIFWITIPFKSIDEPIFIVEGVDFKLLVALSASEGHHQPLWLDDLFGINPNDL